MSVNAFPTFPFISAILQLRVRDNGLVRVETHQIILVDFAECLLNLVSEFLGAELTFNSNLLIKDIPNH